MRTYRIRDRIAGVRIFVADAESYLALTAHRLEQEKMAVVIQRIVGKVHGTNLYPDIAGVARSPIFYPMAGTRPEDGVASEALGPGKTVVEGGRCFRFPPAHPRMPIQSFSPRDYMEEDSQRDYMALDLSRSGGARGPLAARAGIQVLDLEVARRHGTLHPVASTYSPDDDAIYDGLGRPGIPVVTMAGILKGSKLPPAWTLTLLLKVGAAGSSCPVEIEFAVNLSDRAGEPHEFGSLQIRPMVPGPDVTDVDIVDLAPEDTLGVASGALGNGILEDVRDVVCVRPDRFARAATPLVAEELGTLNPRLRAQNRPYLLIGPGRWKGTDPWLGIPVRWAQISGVRCTVETDLDDRHVDPSQGSHFFHNIVSFGIGYLTVNVRRGGRLDLPWLESLPAAEELDYVRHVRIAEPLEIALNGRKCVGVIETRAAPARAPRAPALHRSRG